MSKTIRWPQYVAGLSAAGGGFAIGSALGWSSPAGSRLVDEEQYFPISQSDFAWVSSIINVGCAISCLPLGVLMNKFGRKWTMLSLVIPFLVGWGLVIWSQNLTMLLIGRFIIGLAGGAFCISAPQYAAEITEKEIRGTVACFMQLNMISGVLFVYIVGAFIPLFWTNVICAIIPIIFGIIFFFMPESPVYLIMENREEETRKTLKWLRGEAYEPQNEIDEMKKNLLENEGTKMSLKQAYGNRASIISLIIGFGVIFFQQGSGISLVVFYTTFIFGAADTGIDNDMSTIIIGSLHLVATFVASQLVDRVGRKKLLLVSAVFVTITLFSLGSFFFIQDNYYEASQGLGWLPLTSLCIYIIFYAQGYGPLPWVVLSEIYSKDIKAVGGPVSGSFNWVLGFIVTATFNPISDAIGVGQTFWIFGGISVLGVIFIFLVLPETKGKSLADIQLMFSGGTALNKV